MFYKKLPSLNLLVISISFAFMHNSAVANNVIVDAEKSANTTVSKNGDGSETISINKANDMNLSVNYFEQFNVGKEGVNIDNSEAKAKVILNEVTSKKTSSLEGKISVLGQDAELIIANPNGIDCYGCQFSGSDKVMLISGKLDSITGKKIYLSDGYVNLKNVNNFNEKQTINVFSNRINILGKNKIPLFNVINGYEMVSFVGYVWKGEQEKVLSKDNQEGLSILENSSLKTDLFSLQGGVFNLDGNLITKKINIIRNKEINANEKSIFAIINKENEFRAYNEVDLMFMLASMKLYLLERDTKKSAEIALELEALEEKIMELDPHNIYIHKNKLKKIRKLATEARRVAEQQQAEYNKIQSAVLKIDEAKQAEKRKLEAEGKEIGTALQYIESDNINFKGILAIINSEVLFNGRNINVDIDKTTSYVRNSGVSFNAHQDNNYSGGFGLRNSSIRFLGYRNIPIGDGNDDNGLNKNKLNDINLNKLSILGFGQIFAHGDNINITDVKFKETLSDDGLSKTYIDLIADNEINIKGQFKPFLINEYNLFKFANKITENDKAIFDINPHEIK
ncbi:TPA: filamentous hemagglutinin N-terminal domain-containing protein [Proteus mirabilis]|uniref:two-partner secretion domain-containing protein n=12 Tax=Proteus mirabilis TaxID=584 RepID=UPI001044EECC|nr:filamentous hemagglutinin N-terminal domain-containing protein [Proteus mirabilis]MBG2872130.1 filamentous hemagglutinin N-terminal domain-containing protein [Proteus mirabilis]MBG2883365.1 filamentous hemagglutinin N-terminal domain-containing protein [Proteus mirabilis]MCD4594990.1 filamentous hemagglutinin N-terminal domain-containing protein [Proteus mirabilis]MCD4597259.1 filamentous hemagglutinin N-terminal domain-containing protein [Proteus mirabilis]MCD4606241.1 filamentous hemagglu